MSVESTQRRVGRLVAIDVSVAGPSDVAGALVDVRVVRGWLDAVEADLAKRQIDLAETLGAAPTADVLGRSGKTSRRSAERIAQRAAALADAPSMAAGLAGGAISAEHADVFASVTGRVDDAVRIGLFDIEHELTADATGRTPEQFRRRLIERVRDMSADDGVGRSEQQREQARVHIAIDECSGMGEIRGEPPVPVPGLQVPPPTPRGAMAGGTRREHPTTHGDLPGRHVAFPSDTRPARRTRPTERGVTR